MRGRLVQKQHPRLPDQHARQSDRLFLAAGQAAAALGDGHVVPHRMAGDKALDPGQARGGKHLLVGGLRFSERNIVAQLAKEQIGVLHRKADAGAQIGRIVLPGVDAIDQDAAFLGFIETEQQPPDGGLSRSDPADDADPLAAFDLERDLFQRFGRRVGVGRS